ncbi:MAG: ferritin-like domain-containing protein [Oscillospiraceae bacterium]|nr:ferritin-like domain-containing protein [Oscillospiraceae bacterium]
MDLSDFIADFSYPEIGSPKKNQTYARMILNDCGGMVSEMSSYALYEYDAVITRGDELLSPAFQQIRNTERKHLEIFLELAFALGADPRLWEVSPQPQSTKMRYWSPSRLPYAANTKVMLQNAIALERASIAVYEKQLNEIKDESVQNILRRILIDEQMHMSLFRALLEETTGR